MSVFRRGTRRDESEAGRKTVIARAEDLIAEIGGIVFGCCIAVGGADR